jgi:hypothetical protein
LSRDDADAGTSSRIPSRWPQIFLVVPRIPLVLFVPRSPSSPPGRALFLCLPAGPLMMKGGGRVSGRYDERPVVEGKVWVRGVRHVTATGQAPSTPPRRKKHTPWEARLFFVS